MHLSWRHCTSYFFCLEFLSVGYSAWLVWLPSSDAWSYVPFSMKSSKPTLFIPRTYQLLSLGPLESLYALFHVSRVAITFYQPMHLFVCDLLSVLLYFVCWCVPPLKSSTGARGVLNTCLVNERTCVYNKTSKRYFLVMLCISRIGLNYSTMNYINSPFIYSFIYPAIFLKYREAVLRSGNGRCERHSLWSHGI